VRGFRLKRKKENLGRKLPQARLDDNSKVHITVVQMPAMNTPQFDWVKTKMPRHPQPVPPIYQPEVAAGAIYFAAHARRREVWVGGSTVKAMVGQKFIPGLLDIYLGKTGYKSQETDEPVSPTRRDNLWEPVPGDHGAHGAFDSRASAKSYELWLSKNKWLLTAVAGGLAVGGYLAADKLMKPDTERAYERTLRTAQDWSERMRDKGAEVAEHAGSAAGTAKERAQKWARATKESARKAKERGSGLADRINEARDLASETIRDIRQGRSKRDFWHFPERRSA
jgi:hypothetical protein